MDESERQRDICNAYKSTLTDLTNNSKPVINVLTMLADEYKELATHIVRILEKRLREVNIDLKLPVLYLIDSIVKNVGGQYQELFTQNLVSNFAHVFEQAGDKIRHSLCKLRNTWDGIFPARKLMALDNKMHELDRNWSVPPKNIHVNPRFIENNVQPRLPQPIDPEPRREHVRNPNHRPPARPTEFEVRPYDDFPVEPPIFDAEDGYMHIHDDYRPSRDDYRPSHDDFRHSHDDYRPPHDDFRPSHDDYRPSHDDYRPSHEYIGPPRPMIDDWRPPGPQHPDTMYRPYGPARDWQEQRPHFEPGPPPPRSYKGIRKRKEDPRLEMLNRGSKRARRRATVSPEKKMKVAVKPTESVKPDKNQQKKSSSDTSTQRSNQKSIDKDKGNAPDLQSLVQNLIKNGILPGGESPISDSNVIPQLSLKEEDLKKNYVGIIEKLYKNKQCSMCGERFSADGEKSQYSNHLDWHFRYNSRKNDSRRYRSRQWYFLLEDWTTCEDLDDPDKGAFSKFFEDAKSQELDDEKVLPSLRCNLIPNSADQICALCHEAFTDKFWEESDEEWHFRNAILVNGKAYHASCYDDAIGNRSIDVHNNIIAKKLNEGANADDTNDDKTEITDENKTGSLEQHDQQADVTNFT